MNYSTYIFYNPYRQNKLDDNRASNPFYVGHFIPSFNFMQTIYGAYDFITLNTYISS